MIWEMVGGVAFGIAIGEYYRRVMDSIRREQLADMRRRQHADDVPFDRLVRPQRDMGPQRVMPSGAHRRAERPQMVTKEQHDQLRRTGHTGGHYKAGEGA